MNIALLLLFTFATVTSLLATRHWLNHVSRALPEYAPSAIYMGVPVVVMVTGVGVLGRLTHSLELGGLGSSVIGILYWAWARRLPPHLCSRPQPSKSQRWTMAIALAFVFALYAIIALKYQMHDEFALFGHKSMVEQLRNGFYPPFLPPLPAQEARYHYGFDILAGILARGFGMSSDAAIDTVTVYLAMLISVASAAVVSEVRPRRFTAAFAVVAIHLSSGLSWLMLSGVKGRHPRCLVQYHHPSCGVDPFYPMPLLNVFQHPVALGLAAFLLLVLLSKPALCDRKFGAKFGPLIVVLGPALALGQIVYFSLGELAVVTAVILMLSKRGFRNQEGVYKRAGLLMGCLILGALLAVVAGGMFTPSDVNETGLIRRLKTFGFPAGAGFFEMWRQHLANLGLGFLLLPLFGIVALFQRRWSGLVLSAFAAGGILIPHIWSYSRSWDIVKFPSAAAFALALLCVIMIDGQVWIHIWLRRSARVLLLAGGVLAAVYLVFPPEPKWRFYEPTQKQADELIGQTIQWWRDHGYEKEELIFSQSNIAPLLSIYGGLSVVGSDSDFHYLGIRSDVLHGQRRHRQAIVRNLDARSMKALNIRWLMFSNEELQNLGVQARSELENSKPKRFEKVAEFKATHPSKTRIIWRVLPQK